MNEIQQKQDYTSRIAISVFASSEIVNSCFDIGEKKTDQMRIISSRREISSDVQFVVMAVKQMILPS